MHQPDNQEEPLMPETPPSSPETPDLIDYKIFPGMNITTKIVFISLVKCPIFRLFHGVILVFTMPEFKFK